MLLVILVLLYFQERDRDTSRRSSRSSSRQRSRGHSDKKPRKSERERREGDIIELSSSDEDVKVIDGNEDEDQGTNSLFQKMQGYGAIQIIHDTFLTPPLTPPHVTSKCFLFGILD